MTLSAGTVTVASDLSHSGSGAALELYESLKTIATSDATWDDAPDAQKKAMLDNFALLSTKLGVLVDYIKNNAVVSVTIGTGDAGLQRMPASTAEDTPTKAPASAKSITGTVA